MGFEPMMRVLQFCTVGSANENYLQCVFEKPANVLTKSGILTV